MTPFAYFVGSNKTDFDNHPVVVKTKESLDETGIGWIFPDVNEARQGMACETSLRKIDHCDVLVAVPKDDGTFGESTTWEIAYALHVGKDVLAGKPDGDTVRIVDISQLAYYSGGKNMEVKSTSESDPIDKVEAEELPPLNKFDSEDEE